jgi:urease accessory protein
MTALHHIAGSTRIINDIYTKEDQRLLTVAGALTPERIMGVETGGCPHTAIRDPRGCVDQPRGGGPHAREVSRRRAERPDDRRDRRRGGREDPAQGWPCITKSGLFVIDKTDLAPHVGANIEVMETGTRRMRGGEALRDEQPAHPRWARQRGRFHRKARPAAIGACRRALPKGGQ